MNKIIWIWLLLNVHKIYLHTKTKFYNIFKYCVLRPPPPPPDSRDHMLHTVIAICREITQYDDIDENECENHPMFGTRLLLKAQTDFLFYFGNEKETAIFCLENNLFVLTFCFQENKMVAHKNYFFANDIWLILFHFVISRCTEGPGREILQRPLSVCPSVRLSRLVFAL